MNRTENQLFCATKKYFRRMLDRWYHPLLESRMWTFSFRTCMSSQTRSSAQAQVRWIQSRLQTNWEHDVESIMNSNNCKHRNDTARDTINIEWHVCFRNTSFQLIQSYTNVCRRTGTNPRVFQTRPVLRACSTTSPIASRNVSGQRERIGRHAARFRSDSWCFHGPSMLQTSILTSKTRNRSTRSGIFDEFDAAWPFWWEKGVNKTTSTKRRPSAEKFISPHCWLFATWNIQNRRNIATIWRQNSLAKRYRQRRYWWLRGFHRTKSINVSHSSR